MSEENFIALDNKFVIPVKHSQHKGYQSSHNYKDIATKDYTGRVTFDALVIKKNIDDSELLSPLDTHADYVTFSKLEAGAKYSALFSAINVVKVFQDINKEHKLTSEQAIEELLSTLKTAHQEKTAFFDLYGDFSLNPTRKNFNPHYNTQLQYLFENVDKYEADAEVINKKIRKCKTLFEAHVRPFIFEKLHSYGYSISVHNRKNLYLPADPMSFLFPLASIGLAQKALLKAMAGLKEKNQSIFDCLDSIEKRNAKKDLKGYVLYQNHTTGEEGFMDYENRLTKNLLAAKIFETSDQAYLYSKRRRKTDCVVIEVDFSFSKIVIDNKCTHGESLNNLIIRREEADFKEIIAELPKSEEQNLVKPKRHKI